MTDGQRLPPHDIETEEAVLGGVLIDPDAWHDIAYLEPGHFFRVKNGQIFRAMRKLADAGTPIDYVTLTEATNHEDDAYIIGLMTVVPTAVQTRHYASVIWKLAKRRELLTAAGQVADYAFDDDLDFDAIMDGAQSAVINAVDGGGKQGATPIADGLRYMYDVTAERYAAGGKVTGLATGIKDLDAILEGLEPGSVYVLAARPGMGKSALEGTLRLNAARGGARVLSFNLEMPELQCWQRLVAAATNLEFKRIRRGNMSPQEWTMFGEALGRLHDLKMWIDDTPSLTATQMHSKARRIQAMHGLDLVTVDYLQLMASNGKYTNRVSQVGEISRSLKRLALSLDVPVLALSQLNRGVEARNDKRPMLADLRDSGDIEQDADVVMFLYRDDYYYKDDSDVPNQAEIIVAKHRNGELGTAHLYFDGKRMRFANLQREVVGLPRV